MHPHLYYFQMKFTCVAGWFWVLFHSLPEATSFAPPVAAWIPPLPTTSSTDRCNRNPTALHTLAATSVDNDSGSSSSSSSSIFEKFEYTAHWYPVIWAHELRLKEPTKVTVFDVDYVVAKLGEHEVVALQDKCPHKAAALSQGRVTESGRFQCAYHGWSFDGKTGDCLEIPQVVKPDGTMPSVPARSCAKAVPAQIHQNMVWIFPGGGLEKALEAPPPPTVAEVDRLGFRLSTAMRDMPVDWPIVISNICDADHGLFAHQAKTFDMYSAGKDYPLQISESFPSNGKGWNLNTQVNGTEKLLEIDRNVRGIVGRKKEKNHADKEPPIATSSLQLPTHLQLKRVDRTTNSTSFVAGFYICPTGVGRTRFMSAGFSKKPPKSWLTKLFLDNFLDQDTYLLATQQQYILQQEAKDIRTMMAERNLSVGELASQKMTTRGDMFCLSSPSERAGAKIEQFWDATLLRVPNRVSKLLQLDEAGAFLRTPSREFVLDRKSQHLDITPSAQDVVRNCDKAVSLSTTLTLTLIAAKILGRFWGGKASIFTSFIKPLALLSVGAISAVVSFLAKKIKAEYYFKYTDDIRRKDLSKIPKMIWSDK